jgi:LacI family transcriptional regulator
MATIKEVARRARVSVGTVSNVLSGTIPVSKRLKTRVRDAIEQLDYHPNFVARSLKIKRTKTIGIVISDIGNPFFSQLLRGAEDAAWQEKYMLITFNTDERPERESQVLDALRDRRVDGILLAAAAGNHKHLRAFKESGIPIVCVDREITGLGLDCVVVDNFSAARECVHHLATLGHRRIGLLNGDLNLPVARDRYFGYRQGLEDFRLAFEESITCCCQSFQLEDGYRAALRMMSRAPRPTAMFTGNAMLALGLLRALKELGLRCPEDVGVVMFDDPRFTDVLRPSLTAVAQPSHELGRRGFELLLRRIANPNLKRTRVVLPTQLNIRESSGLPRVAGSG